MSLESRLKPLFDSGVRTRGNEYFRSRRVKHISTAKLKAVFQVTGSRVYRVSIDCGHESIQMTCTCPYFDSGVFCKHIWSAVLRADELTIFSEDVVKPQVKVRLPEEEDAFEDFLYEQDGNVEADDKSRAPDSNVSWKQEIERVVDLSSRKVMSYRDPRAEKINKILSVAISLNETFASGKLHLYLYVRERLTKGGIGVLRTFDSTRSKITAFESQSDREILWDLVGKADESPYLGHYSSSRGGIVLDPKVAVSFLKKIDSTGKLFCTSSSGWGIDPEQFRPYEMRDQEWRFELKLEKEESQYTLRAFVVCNDETRSLGEVLDFIPGLIFFDDCVALSSIEEHRAWVDLFNEKDELRIPEDEIDSFLGMYLRSNNSPQITLPESVQFKRVDGTLPKARFILEEDPDISQFPTRLEFEYLGLRIPSSHSTSTLFDVTNKLQIERNFEFEVQVAKAVESLIVKSEDRTLIGFIPNVTLGEFVTKATSENWEVLVHDRKIASSKNFDIKIRSGVDWFDLQAEMKFSGQAILLPQLLKHLKSGERFMKLDDGTLGLLPENWMAKLNSFSQIGEVTEEGVRLSKVQALFLASDLQEIEGFEGDRRFKTLNTVLEQIKSPPKVRVSALFKGELRPYQREGLSWLTTLGEESMGGILADEMGLGKTVQLLAMLAGNFKKQETPSLVVAPKSLVFNWQNEAKKFVPGMKILNFTGPNRKNMRDKILKSDLILTTYQTLRSDIEEFKNIEFDTVILDEAHYIKNPSSQAHQACRLLKARRRFSLTGTPVENSISDLLSIFSVTIPGLIGQSQASRWVREVQPEKIASLGKAFQPFILRRTKKNVLTDLPEKSEQTVFCELSEGERKNYDELKKHYWDRLSGEIKDKGLAGSKIHVLEALLRLRQASCHQGLIDTAHAGNVSAKFEVLLEHLETIVAEGHKALVFSQFTSLLHLFQIQLDSRKIKYAYLDGKTKDREAVVSHFQNDKNVPLFLLSLKVGGVGLNLTAADYVFILDPWWNPASEAQAIDRTHRIGQKNKVFAYKLIAKDTVEEKILALQKKKRELAEALVSDDKSVLKGLELEDLRELFS